MLSQTELEIPDIITCDFPSHDGIELVQLCLDAKCDKRSVLCHICITELHRDCSKFKLIKDIPNLVQPFKQLNKYLKNLEEHGNRSELIPILNKLLEPVNLYLRDMNRSNMKELGKFLKKAQENEKQAKNLIKEIEQEYTKKIPNQMAHQFFAKGMSLYNEQKYNEAIGIFDKSISLLPLEPEPYHNKGNALYQLQKYNKAIECYDQAIKCYRNIITDDPKSESKSWHNKGIILQNQKKYQLAIECFTESNKINPNQVSFFNIIGSVLYDQKKYPEAIDSYRKAIDIDDQNQQAWNGQGNALLAMNKNSDAAHCFTKALSINEQFALAWNGKGAALYKQKQYKDAIDCYQKAIQIDPQYTQAIQNLEDAKYVSNL